jgi:hypothetical protein
MLTEENIQKMEQNNVGADSALTKKRGKAAKKESGPAVEKDAEAPVCGGHCFDDMTHEDAALLLQAQFIQAKYNPNGQDSIAQIKGLLANGLQSIDSADKGAGIVVHHEATKQNGDSMYIRAYLQWGASKVDNKFGWTGSKISLNCAYVWYDLFIYDADSGAELARKLGIYGDSGWRFKNSGMGYVIEK